jgi:Diphthamide biosynthesis methyltransferase
MSGIGCTGLQLYNFGQTVSMVFFTETWKPSSFYDRIKENVQIGLHTLVLLDIKVKEQSLEDMARGRKVFQPPRYMTVSQCAAQMLEIEEERKGGRVWARQSCRGSCKGGRSGPEAGRWYPEGINRGCYGKTTSQFGSVGKKDS